MISENNLREMIAATVLWWRKSITGTTDAEEFADTKPGETFFKRYERIQKDEYNRPDKKMGEFMEVLFEFIWSHTSSTPRLTLRTDFTPIPPFSQACKRAGIPGKWKFPHHAATILNFSEGTVLWTEFKKPGGVLFSTQTQAA